MTSGGLSSCRIYSGKLFMVNYCSSGMLYYEHVHKVSVDIANFRVESFDCRLNSILAEELFRIYLSSSRFLSFLRSFIKRYIQFAFPTCN